MWVLEDVGTYARAAAFDEARPVFTRSTLGTAVVGWTYGNEVTGWREAAAGKVYLPDACYSLDGRMDGSVWRIYTASRSALYVVTPSTATATILARAPAGQLFRGLVVSPFGQQAASSQSETISAAASNTATKSKNPKK